MSNRIAFFGNAEKLIEEFELNETSEVLFEAHYNISRGHHIPVIKKENGGFTIGRMRWGKEFERHVALSEKADNEHIKKLEKESSGKVIIPLSGFYIWKDEKNKDHPFFVRKIDNTLLYAAAFTFESDKKDFKYAELIMMESNTLIQPIAETMPVVLKQDLAKEWLRGNLAANEILKTAASQFLITDLTVHRVTKEVKDLSNNEASLIQPIPK